ncbi:hypothetical protein [Ktedonospora formicarum]|uniref:Uncharacterized protein n=1 Tax=Ktedonospora formicarum TaxID=2778364 RepID=A0A8J3I1G8_9CHLR|nr:hypothetical protein [Ktedonospora formicarum]GHO44512.1 hypothetical protein KSX_26750 [Ktedonospora formicarum]
MGLRVTLAGVDITKQVDESTISISNTLGQGAGTGGGGSGRAATCTLRSTLGPISQAVGAGTKVTTPTLVRQGEIRIYDSSNNCIFGGFATKFTDATLKTTIYTTVECHDYWQSLARVVINENFENVTDIQFIRIVLTKYAPWVDLSNLPTKANYLFPIRTTRNDTLQKALQDIADITGFQMWIDPNKKFYYQSPYQNTTAPFSLSNTPNFFNSFNLAVDDYEFDDNSIINRVYFYGGKRPTDDYLQDLSTQVNGTNKTFVLAYYPRRASDQKIHCYRNGQEINMGVVLGDGPENTYKSKGGTADALMNADAKTIEFDVAPPAGSTIQAKYRYELPLVVVLSDNKSVAYFGNFYDGVISDENVIDPQTAVQRCRILLLQQSYGLVTMKVRCWKPGIQAGQTLRIDHDIRQIHSTFVVQQVDVAPLGAGNFVYTISLGAWNWNLVDIVKLAVAHTTPIDTLSVEQVAPVIAETDNENFNVSFTVTTKSQPFGGYYARDTPQNDGHDAYPGFFSITS